MRYSRKHLRNKLLSKLMNERQTTSPINSEIVLVTDEIKRETENWVPMWVDWGHTVRSNCDTATAVRAITDQGELLWYVLHDTKKHGYHSLANASCDAFTDAADAWDNRKLVRSQWPKVCRLSRDLLFGRKKLTLTLEDAERSALCTLGVKGFRNRMHISHKSTLSGRTAAVLMKIEPQLGFVIYEAAQRSGIWSDYAVMTDQKATPPFSLTSNRS